MAFIDMFLSQTATIKPFERIGDGEPIYGTTETRKCRIEVAEAIGSVYKNPDGEIEQIMANMTMFCRGNPIPEKSIVTIDNVDYIVVKCCVMNGFGKTGHLEVLLQ